MTNPLPASGGSYVRLPDGTLLTAEEAAKAPEAVPAPAAVPAQKAPQKPSVKEA